MISIKVIDVGVGITEKKVKMEKTRTSDDEVKFLKEERRPKKVITFKKPKVVDADEYDPRMTLPVKAIEVKPYN